MREIVPIKGATNFTINLDPSVWIFDQRKVDLDVFIQNGEEHQVPERKTTGSYGIPLQPFLDHAEPTRNATKVICHLEGGDSTTISLKEAYHALLAFSSNGKPLREDGPLHLYFRNERHGEPPITQVIAFEVAE
jgi:hypothetical protein